MVDGLSDRSAEGPLLRLYCCGAATGVRACPRLCGDVTCMAENIERRIICIFHQTTLLCNNSNRAKRDQYHYLPPVQHVYIIFFPPHVMSCGSLVARLQQLFGVLLVGMSAKILPHLISPHLTSPHCPVRHVCLYRPSCGTA